MLFHFLFYLFLSLARQINKQNDTKTNPTTHSRNLIDYKLKKKLEIIIKTMSEREKERERKRKRERVSENERERERERKRKSCL